MKSEIVFNTMEVLETKPINELVTEATIKVCYVSELPNRNGTVITKEVGKQIAATLPGAPVVGLFNKDTQDFVEHSRKITIKDGEVHLEDLTKPYGFVSFEKPWYQDFIEDGVNRTYLMCKAYLWTKQYPEANNALDKGQSMELDESSLSGYYEGDVFVFTHATMDKLCILGNNYEPCFEGAKIMTTYAKGFNILAESVEDILGRRYFVHKGQLVPNMEKNTVKYALELGYNLHEAIMNQLHGRGSGNYTIQGIYADTKSGLYVVLQEMTTLAFVRGGITINEDDTIALSPEMQEVSMSWIDKSAGSEMKSDSISAFTATDVNSNVEGVVPVYTTDEEANARIVELEAQVSEFTAKETTYVAQIAELEGKVNEFTLTESGAKIAELEEQIAKYNNQIVELQEQIVQFSAEGEGDEDGEGEKSAAAPAEPSGEPTPEGEPVSVEGGVEGNANNGEDVISAEFTAKITELTNQVAELENQLNAYKAAEQAAEDSAKQDMINSYKAVLSDEEIAPIAEKVNEYSLEQVEEKLSVLYSRKTMKKQEAPTAFQLNVNIGNNENDDIPSFFAQAMEYDKIHQI